MDRLKEIRTFFGKLYGTYGRKQITMVQSKAYECTECRQIFLNKKQGINHECIESIS